ncbi:unnamed protein product [Rhizoctonia solani]|uniref:CHAT domain-containing protein n=1 Tax=Rhizoctonia solani TaxID=456999 RepID=A0A8H3DV99_9AGAM|nr:unnamed protein product [Rhizoctonia solani]
MHSELREVDDDIEFLGRVLSQVEDDDPNLPLLLACLGETYEKRYELSADPNDNKNTIEYSELALALTPEDDESLLDLLATLGSAHIQRFQRLGHADDTEKAIEYNSRALSITPDDDPALARRLSNLAVSYKMRFERLGELGDIEKAIEYDSRAVTATPDDHPHLTEHLSKLGWSYAHRFHRLGRLDDLETAILHQTRGLALAPDGHQRLPIMLVNLGAAHTDRFELLGEISDIMKAIEYRRRAVDLTPDGHPLMPTLLVNLGASRLHRFQHLGDMIDLENAIEHKSRALGLTPTDHPGIVMVLSNLGTAHAIRFQRLDELNDLEKSIEYQSRALALAPIDDPSLLLCRSNLGGSYGHRFQRLGDLKDLDKAIECVAYVLAKTTTDHPQFCWWHFNYAISHILYYEHTANPSHLQDSLNSFRTASKSISGSPRDRFQFARRWALRASKHSSLNCIEAYQTALDLLPQFIWLGATTDQRYQDLLITGTLAVDAASAAILSLDYSLALEWVEHARCVVWNQSLMLRSPVDQLQSSHPNLADRFQTVAKQLHIAGSKSRDSQAFATDFITVERVAQEHRRLAREYNELLSEIRTLSGFEDFLQSIKADRLMRATHYGPIIVIVCHKQACDALIVSPKEDSVNHLPLPNFDWRKAQSACTAIETSLRHKLLRERGFKRFENPGEKDQFEGVLLDLWNSIVKPVLDCLGYMNNFTGALPHITWCPTGPISFLPLHAAGDYSQPRSRVFDYVISSYIPTLTALLATTPSSLNKSSRILGIGLAVTPGHNPLPGTTRELASLQSHIENEIEYSQLMDSQATITSVLDAMEQHDWVHLACHAHQNVNDPTKSGFFLSDGILDLAAINRRAFKSKGLAFLSACQTATGDERLPDEVLHLASGMLMAGYSSVIATMWSIVDDDAPFVADKVYGRLMKEKKVGNGEAGKALHDAVAELREKVGEKSFGRWVPYIHIGS